MTGRYHSCFFHHAASIAARKWCKQVRRKEGQSILADFRGVIGAMSGHETIGPAVKTDWCKGGQSLIEKHGDKLKSGMLLEFKMCPFVHHWLIVMLHSSGRPYVISAYDGRRNDPENATEGFIEYDLVEKITESVRINTEVDEDQECWKILGDRRPVKDILTDALNSTIGTAVKTDWYSGRKSLLENHGDKLKSGMLLEYKQAPFVHHWLIVILSTSGQPWVISAYDGKRNFPATCDKGFIDFDLVENRKVINRKVRINTDVDEDEYCRKKMGEPEPINNMMTDALNSIGDYDYCILSKNCGTFVNSVRYGVEYSFQSEIMRRIRKGIHNNRP